MTQIRDIPRIQWVLPFFTVVMLLTQGGIGQADVGMDLDCTVHTSQSTGTQTSLQAGPMQLRTDADLTATPQQGQAWKHLVDGLLARYVELCSIYKESEITKEEFDFYTEKLKGHYENAKELEKKLSQQAHSPEPTLLEAIHKQNQHLEKLELPEGIPSGAVPRSPDIDLPPDPNKPPSTTGSIGVTPQQESEK